MKLKFILTLLMMLLMSSFIYAQNYYSRQMDNTMRDANRRNEQAIQRRSERMTRYRNSPAGIEERKKMEEKRKIKDAEKKAKKAEKAAKRAEKAAKKAEKRKEQIEK